MKVWDTLQPKRHAWEMSEEGFKQLNEKEPGRYKIKEMPKVISVQKKRPVVVARRVMLPAKKAKGVNS